MPTYKTSSGDRVEKTVIDSRVREAKRLKLDLQLADYGYNFCEECGRSSGMPLDCSHDISIDKCQKNGQSELAWDVFNITIRCRKCHKKHDKL